MAKFYEFCRICMNDKSTLRKDTKFYNIFEECDVLLFGEPISLIAEFFTKEFSISKNDQLPQFICPKCLHKFVRMKEFISICERSQKTQLKLFDVVLPEIQKYEEINITNVLDHDIIDDADFDNMTFDVIEVPKLVEPKVVKIPISDFQEEKFNKISFETEKTILQEPKIIKIPLKKFGSLTNIEKPKILKVRLQKLKDTDIFEQTSLTQLPATKKITEPKIIKLPSPVFKRQTGMKTTNKIIDEPKIVKIPFSQFKENIDLSVNRSFIEPKIRKIDEPQIVKIPLSKFKGNIVLNLDGKNTGNTNNYSSSDIVEDCNEPSVEYFEADDLFDAQISYEVIKTESSDDSDDDEDILKQVEEDFNTFSCPHCIVDCTSVEDLDEHIKRRHVIETKTVQCEECGEILSKQQFTNHYKSKHKGAILFRCNSCDKDFRQEKDFKEHMKLRHCTEPNIFEDMSLLYSCLECGRNFQSKGLLERHKKLKDHFLCATNYKYTFSCDICTRTFSNKVAMEKHKLERHKLDAHISAKYKHKCDQCPRVFPRSDHLKLHIRRVHLGEANFKCELCDRTFVVKSEVKLHIARQHHRSHYKYKKVDDAICSTCNEKLPDYRTLRLHIMEKHSRTPQFKCSICSFEFFKKSKLDRHARLHNIEGLDNEEIIRLTKEFVDLPIDHIEQYDTSLAERDDIIVKTKDEDDETFQINQDCKTNEVTESNEANEAAEALKDSEIFFLDNLIEVDSEQIIG